MINLWITTFIWAFSFPLIGHYISGHMDSFFAAFFRVFLAFLVFLPFLDWRLNFKLRMKICGIGALQIGIMYIFYYHSFAYLSVSEVALFTIFTPFYVSIIYDLYAKRFRILYLLSIGICVFGAFIIKFNGWDFSSLLGFLLIQAANLCFGIGQSLYKVVCEKHSISNDITTQKRIFGYFHLGAAIITGIAFLILGDKGNLPTQTLSIATLVYLGLIASGVGYFIWNIGALKVDSGILAIMNNAVIPVAIVVNAIFWGIDFESKSLILGSSIMAFALWLHYKIIKKYQKE